MPFDDSPISPTLFFTQGQGPGPVTLTSLESRQKEGEEYVAGHTVLEVYERLLDSVLEEGEGSIRLQNGLAAAVAGLSREEFDSLSEDVKIGQRQKFVKRPLTPKGFAPSLIIYEGPKSDRSTPSTSGFLTFDKGPVDDQESEYHPWDLIWDEESTSTTAWGWTACSERPQRLFIFLSGAFISWPKQWCRSAHAAASQAKFTCFLKITLFHELAHFLRTLLFGVVKNLTPPKCIDHPLMAHKTNGCSDMGEGGRLAEVMAFGAVIDLYLDKDKKPRLFVCNLNKEETPFYEIPRRLEEPLFAPSFATPPIDMEHISTTQKPLEDSDICMTQGKKAHSNSSPTFKILDACMPLLEDKTIDMGMGGTPQEFTPIVGDLADEIRAVRSYLVAAKGSCVVVE